MTQFFIAETARNVHITNSHWKKTSAKTLRSAKQIAQRNCLFVGTEAHVGIEVDGEIGSVSSRARNGWIDHDFELGLE
jgi:hypothetical protein